MLGVIFALENLATLENQQMVALWFPGRTETGALSKQCSWPCCGTSMYHMTVGASPMWRWNLTDSSAEVHYMSYFIQLLLTFIVKWLYHCISWTARLCTTKRFVSPYRELQSWHLRFTNPNTKSHCIKAKWKFGRFSSHSEYFRFTSL